MLKVLINAGANLCLFDVKTESVLHAAAAAGHVEVVKALLGAGINHLVRVRVGWTPAHSAARHGHVDVLKALIEAGEDPSIEDHSKRTPAHYAAQAGSVDMLKVLLDENQDLETKDSEGHTPVHVAAMMTGREDALRFLIDEADVDYSIEDNEGCTPLVLAAARGHDNSAKLLIEAGADTCACEEGIPVNFLLLQNECMNAFRASIDRGVDLTITIAEGATLAHAAAWAGNGRALEMLIDVGADLSVGDFDGMTPVHYAVERCCRELY